MDVSWIKSQLAEHGMTQAELASRAGMTEAMLSKSLKGHRLMKADEIDNIRRAFGFLLPEDLPSNDPRVRVLRNLSSLPAETQQTLVLFLESLAKSGSDGA